jgi:Domain of unknown function (DUF4389)
MVKKINEKKEAWIRIIIGIISEIILNVWQWLVIILSVINWFIVVFTGKKNKDLAEFSEYWNFESYKLTRYMTFVSNKRPFPFSKIEKMSKFQ